MGATPDAFAIAAGLRPAPGPPGRVVRAEKPPGTRVRNAEGELGVAARLGPVAPR